MGGGGRTMALIPFTVQAQNAHSVVFEMLFCSPVCKQYYIYNTFMAISRLPYGSLVIWGGVRVWTAPAMGHTRDRIS